jgi:PAS domain S-box-containing protein
MTGETVRSEEDAFPRADGQIQWVRWEMRPWLTGDQTVGGITIMAEDVTARVEAARALRANCERVWPRRRLKPEPGS